MKTVSCSRRAAFRAGARWLLVPAAIGTFVIAPERAAAKASKAEVSYRETPKDGKSCSTCRLFTPSEPGKGNCAAVEGPVSANGWCLAYSSRG